MNPTVTGSDLCGKICDQSDPRMILTVKFSNKKAIQITHFLTEVTIIKRQEILFFRNLKTNHWY